MRLDYRLRVYDTDDVTVLTPVGGMAHSDAFQVSTIEGLAGYKGYLDRSTAGRNARINMLSKHAEIGGHSLRLFDPRVTPGSGSNLTRWVEAFLGDAKGQERLKGLKVIIEESENGGLTWPTWFTGRLHSLKRSEPQWWTIEVKDSSEEVIDLDLFVQAPHSSIAYVTRQTLWPVGTLDDYGPFLKVVPITSIASVFGASGGVVMQLTVNNLWSTKSENVISRQLSDQLLRNSDPARLFAQYQGERKLYCRVKQTSGAESGTTREHPVLNVGVAQKPNGQWRITDVRILASASGSQPIAGAACEILLYSLDKATDRSPFLVDDIHPAQLWKDILDGKFFRLETNGNVRRTIPYDVDAFTHPVTGLIADTSLGVFRGRIDKVAPAKKWIQENILQPYGLAYRIAPNGSIVPLKVRQPTSFAGVPTLTDADLADPVVPFDTTRSDAAPILMCTYYEEQQLTFDEIGGIADEFPVVEYGRIASRERLYIRPYVQRPGLGDRETKITGLGLRFGVTTAQQTELYDGIDRREWVQRFISGHLEDLSTMFAAGPMITVATCRRASAVAAGLTEGALTFAAFSTLPDPATGKLGGTRAMRVIEHTAGGTRTLRLLDCGLNVTAIAPTPGVLAQETGNTRHGIVVPVTVNAGAEPVRIEVAVTDTSVGAAPAAGSALWVFGARVTATGNATIRYFPNGKRVWVRMRSEPSAGPSLPSAWVSPATAYVDLAAVTACSGLGTAVTSGIRCLFTFTPGDAALPIELLYVTPDSGTPAYVLTLPPGSNRYQFEGLAPSTSHKVAVRQPDGHGGYSAQASTTFNTTASSVTAPAAPALALIVGTP